MRFIYIYKYMAHEWSIVMRNVYNVPFILGIRYIVHDLVVVGCASCSFLRSICGYDEGNTIFSVKVFYINTRGGNAEWMHFICGLLCSFIHAYFFFVGSFSVDIWGPNGNILLGIFAEKRSYYSLFAETQKIWVLTTKQRVHLIFIIVAQRLAAW